MSTHCSCRTPKNPRHATVDVVLNYHSQNSVSKFKVKSAENFETISLISSFYFEFLSLMDEVYFEKARSSKNKNNNNKPFFSTVRYRSAHTRRQFYLFISVLIEASKHRRSHCPDFSLSVRASFVKVKVKICICTIRALWTQGATAQRVV